MRNIGKTVLGRRSLLTCEVGRLEGTVAFLAPQERLELFPRRWSEKRVGTVLVLKCSARSSERHPLAVASNIMIAGNAIDACRWYTASLAQGVEERGYYLVLLWLSGKGEIAAQEHKIEGQRVAPVPNVVAHGAQDEILLPRVSMAQVDVREMKPGDRAHRGRQLLQLVVYIAGGAQTADGNLNLPGIGLFV